MPQINRIRINNVKYNNGTQTYDDFKMELSCSNTLYDLANGGGKSLLMLLLMQNLIPNCHLDDKQPIEKLFRGKDSSNVIHSLIEWRLDDGDKSGYKYMTTGFCARKGTENPGNIENKKDTTSFDYFNYCIFYNTYNENDINNLSLQDNKERITYGGLKKQLRTLQSDNSFVVVSGIFEDRKGEYQRFISEHGLYESEWEIIRGINKTEGHVRGYFEENYRTSRKIVEDLLIEKIIQKAFMAKTNKVNDEEEMAKTLFDIKDKIIELSKKKKEISNYDRQASVVNDFIIRTKTLINVYDEKDKIEDAIVKTYNTLESKKKSKYEELNLIEGETNNINEEDKKTEKNIQTIKLQIMKNELNITQGELKNSQDKFENVKLKVDNVYDEINLRQVKNYFVDFLENKYKHSEIKEVINNIFKANENLTSDLNILAYNKKIRDEIKLKELNNKLTESLSKVYDFSSKVKEFARLERDIDNKIAVSESNILQSKERLNSLKEKVKVLRNQLNIMIIGDIDGDIKKIDLDRSEAFLKIKDNKYVFDSLMLKNSNYKIDIAKNEEKTTSIQGKIVEYDDLTHKYDIDKIKVNKLLEVYGVRDVLSLSNSLEIKYNELLRAILAQEQVLQQSLDYYAQLDEDKPMPTTKEILKVKRYINRNYNEDGILGIEYLKDLSIEEKETLLSKIPFLPYSIIVTYNFNKLIKDEKFRDCDFGNYAIPIISLETIKDDFDFNINGLDFALKDRSKFINSEKIKEEKDKIGGEISEIRSNLDLLKRNEETLKIDNTYIKEFKFSYDNKIDMIKADRTKLNSEKISLENERIVCSKAVDGLEFKMKNINLENIDLENKLIVLDRDLKNISELKIDLDNLDLEENKFQRFVESLNSLNLKHMEIKKQMITEESKQKNELEVNSHLKGEIDEVNDEWTKMYKTYYNNDKYEELNITDDEIDAKFRGSKKALEEKNSDIRDKDQLLQNYQSNMDKDRSEIDNREYSIDKLYELKDRNEISVTKQEELKELKEEHKILKEKQEVVNKDVQKYTLARSNICGKIELLEDSFSKDFGQYVAIEIEAFKFQQFEEENTRKREKLALKKAELLILQIKINKVIEKLKAIIVNIEVVLRSSNISKDKTNDMLEETLDIKSYYEGLEKDFDKVCIKEKNGKSSFESNKEKNIKTLKEMGAFDLAEEFLRSINAPVLTIECKALIENLESIKELIFLQQGKIENDIKDMEQIKDNFQNQCLQRCRDVKTELDRLPRLSRLNLNNEIIQMVSLQLPYVKEEQQKFHMSLYIEEIIRNVDNMDDNLDKIKYIKNQLALKRLFSVIVTDMNKIVLKLYKREQISEQSKILEYEQAVGSTGQSQGIYIQFLISIINYIKNINSFNVDNNKLRKIIFIDNPFGAAKDIYIWEPIFEFLKTNNVQLIVPARGATPAISGRFDVNYILGQKLIGNKQQTVVMQVRSQVCVDQVEFKKIEHEQLGFELS
ncbi:coiled-coil domain-containing protein [Clostridium estertheticum]|uniref:Chromosome segregation ATPase n=1 Tax=Clostridium estertheticum subsp. estertheticum TaxID=1552 RepID=A0A1J0GFL6_9CLOT|nr:hypothetical protein [Clostridium estertheticum]APC40161.1 hypothetical protein A7L45_08815 [Clostridium estertheticum subsp. estertheticum]MBZ9618052.1 hypothetical protein [Clostridium estertheticum subsp. laramiense]WAG73709.1 hypothetical protein LL032_21730 [Clostridium estertheticum]